MRAYRLYAGMFVLAAAVRIGALAVAGFPAAAVVPGRVTGSLLDGEDYHRLAVSLLEHGTYGYEGRASSYRPPAYPAFVAAVYAVCGPSPLAVRWVQVFLGASACVLLAACGRRMAGTYGAAAAGTMAACHPLFVFYGGQLLSETLAVFLAAFAWFLLVRERHGNAGTAAAGVAWGLAALTRSAFLPLAAVPVVLILRRGGKAWAAAFVFYAGTAVAVLPWTVRNCVLHGRIVPVSLNGGYNFYLGSAGFETWSGRSDAPLPADAPFSDTAMEGGEPPVPETAADRAAYRSGTDFIARHPLRYLRYAVVKTVDFWDILPAGGGGGAARAAVFLYNLLLVAAGAAGCVALASGPLRTFGTTAAAFLVASTLLHALFISNARMRVPMADPLLLVTAAAGIPYLFVRLFRRGRMQRKTTVLMFHSVVRDDADLERLDPVDRPYAVRLDRFRNQLDSIVSRGYAVAGPEAFGPDHDGGGRRTVVLTFDDGYDDFVRLVLPELRSRNLPAVLFMTSAYVGRPGYLTTDDLRTCARAGITVGSHGHSHRFFSQLGDDELQRELRESVRIVGAATERTVDTVSLPGGRGVRRAGLVRSAGFRLVFSSRFGWPGAGAEAHVIPRLPVVYTTTEGEFGRLLDRDSVYCGWRELAATVKFIIQRLLGDRLYDRLYALRYGGGTA